MKILFVSNSLNGLFHFRMDVMMHLKSIGYEVVGVVPSSDRNKLDVNGLKFFMCRYIEHLKIFIMI